jgi:hypothetical protein
MRLHAPARMRARRVCRARSSLRELPFSRRAFFFHASARLALRRQTAPLFSGDGTAAARFFIVAGRSWSLKLGTASWLAGGATERGERKMGWVPASTKAVRRLLTLRGWEVEHPRESSGHRVRDVDTLTWSSDASNGDDKGASCRIRHFHCSVDASSSPRQFSRHTHLASPSSRRLIRLRPRTPGLHRLAGKS